ncbi:cohesin domain-containing protein [Sabulibacter ruber]|uniref:Ig-like domain-containing protein n=1 Tax=Sabulibacter ruber TaxID=2811901 RepID=UPI001A970CA9|nr:cohesin domain-containing protein [Sabulibacter ruber]
MLPFKGNAVASGKEKSPQANRALAAEAITLYADSVAGLPNTEVLVPVRVKGFNNMITGQGTITFNPAVATYVGVEQYGLPGMTSSNFGTTQASSGRIVFSWDDATLAGKTLTDGSMIFVIRLKVVGTYGTNTSISFTNSPVPLEFVDKAFATAQTSVQSGKVQVPSYAITTSALSNNSLCAGSSVSVAFTRQGSYTSNNTFSVQLSNASGSFASPTVIGTGAASPIAATIPATTVQGTGYRIRVVSSSPAITGTDNGSNITISTLPSAPTISSVERCGPGTVTLTASGAPTGGSYRWYTVATGGTAISGATAATYTTPSLSATTTYYVATANSAGCESSRVAVVATVVPALTNNTISAAQTICSGSVPAQLTGTQPTGGSGTYTYQWERSADGTTFAPISGATGQNYSPAALTADTWFRRKVTSGNSCPVNVSATVKVTVSPVPASPVLSNAAICNGEKATLAVNSPNTAYTYRWYTVATGGTAFFTGSSYTTATLSASTTYYVEAASTAGCVSGRTAVTVTVNAVPAAPSVTGAERCGNGSVTLSASGAPAGATYRWYTAASGGTAISGATGTTYATPSLTATTTYYVSVVNSSNCESGRTAVTATINAEPNAPTVTAAERCGTGSLTLTASGAPAGATYRWYIVATGGTAINGATGASYTTPSLSATTTYYVSVVSSANCESTRTPVTATVKATPATPVATASATQVGGTLKLSASTVTGATYSWTGPNGFTSTQQNPTIPNATTAHSGTYSVVAIINGCSSVAGTVTVTVINVPPVTFDVDSVSGLANTEILVPVRVKGFKDIVSVQYSVNWNTNVASFVGVEDFGLTGLTATSFGTTQTATGNLMLSWTDASLKSYTLADSTILFKIRLKLIGSMGQSTPITIADQPTPVEVSEKNGFIVPVIKLAGAATIRKQVKISGQIKSEQGEGIRTVTLTATGGATPLTYETKPDGLYEFQVMQNGTYTISPFKNNDATANNGITTLDIALIRRHILNITALGSPYKILAADADNSSSVTTTDIASIRKVVLTIDNSFPGNRLWRFVPQSFKFPNPANPFPFKDSVQVHTSVAKELTGQDFIGVKIGDVNNTWDSKVARVRTAGDIAVQLQDQQVLPGAEVLVPVKVAGFKNVSGYQFTLAWDATVLEFVSVENAAAQGAFGTHKITEGKLTTAWDDPAGKSQTLPEGSVLFYVKLRAIGALHTQTEVAITSDLTRSVAYNQNLQQLNVKPTNAKILVGNAVQVTPGYTLHQNVPNPFAQNGTSIKFSVPQQEEVRISIYNSLGQLVRTYTSTYAAGEHEVLWDGTNSQGGVVGKGTYLYRMEAGKFTQTKRAIIL